MANADSVLLFLREVWALDHALQTRSKAMGRTLGITGPQRLVLRLVQAAGACSAGDLAAQLHLHPSTLTGVLQRLETGGYLSRAVDSHDGRRAVLRVTTAGTRMLRRRGPAIEEALRVALQKESPRDVQTTTELLHRLAEALSLRASKHAH